jgi:hypothetical protein
VTKETCIGCRRLVPKDNLAPTPVLTAQGPKHYLLCSQCRDKLNRQPSKSKTSVQSALLGIFLVGDLFDAGSS